MHTLSAIKTGPPLTKATGAVILIHGRGSTAQNILQLASEFPTKEFQIVAPQATGNTWYPYSFMAPISKNEPWLSSAVQMIHTLIDDLAKVIPSKNIYIMGFSQGACLALETVAQNAQEYGGVAAFTGGLIGEILDIKRYKGDFKNTPIFIGNSDFDPHVPENRSSESAQILRSMGAVVDYNVYPGKNHTIIADEIDKVHELLFSKGN